MGHMAMQTLFLRENIKICLTPGMRELACIAHLITQMRIKTYRNNGLVVLIEKHISNIYILW